MSKRLVNGLKRVRNGLLEVCALGAMMFGGIFAAYLIFAQGLGWGIVFGALFTTVFVLGVMSRE